LAHLIERNVSQKVLDVSRGGDGHAHAAHLTACARIIGIEAHLCRQVQRNREALLTLLDEGTDPSIRFGGRVVARVHAHNPRLALVELIANATGEGELASWSRFVS
jgi:hypothetical protein